MSRILEFAAPFGEQSEWGAAFQLSWLTGPMHVTGVPVEGATVDWA